LRRIAPVALVVLAGCPLISVEAEIPDACLTYAEVEIGGVPHGVAFTFTKTLDEVPLIDGFVSFDAAITEARATLRARSGVSDLHFVDGLVVTIDNGERAPFVLVACEHGSCASPTRESAIAIDTPADLIDYLTTGPAEIKIEMTGALPTETWVADIEICLSGSARLTVEP